MVEPVLACAARGIEPPCEACARGEVGLCTRTAHGTSRPALQTGFCEDTGGGWGTMLVAHASQLHAVPDELSDEAAVLIEPLACAVHAVLRADVSPGSTVLVSGAGTMGLLTIAALQLAHVRRPRSSRSPSTHGSATRRDASAPTTSSRRTARSAPSGSRRRRRSYEPEQG